MKKFLNRAELVLTIMIYLAFVVTTTTFFLESYDMVSESFMRVAMRMESFLLILFFIVITRHRRIEEDEQREIFEDEKGLGL